MQQIAAADRVWTLADKVAFLSRPKAYRPAPAEVTPRETHMSWVFLAGDRVYKLKKPVRFPYLDFSTLARREAACRAELRLNRRLAPTSISTSRRCVARDGGLAIGGAAAPVDWLVVMQRLDERFMLDRLIEERRLTPEHLDRLADDAGAFLSSRSARLPVAGGASRRLAQALR